ncbi:MAG: DUF302 domain-containing protein [Kofleriaceae bacterium]|nr:DUF302 domain-containing protein [Myxococcales bacterium]MCB9563361.1 DUF302 domain-containing protein [Kofleriaceae bacterium]MCB9573651.1 DUF302 domain-containing protein [Kofleriaceae bacterium]
MRFGSPSYTITRQLTGVDFAGAVAATRAALATEGFGVLTEIDVQATLKAKLGADLAPYLILGACNPPLAHQAITAEPGIGALLPCNVVVAQQDDGSIAVSAIDPKAMFAVVDNPAVAPIADGVRDRLTRALEAIKVG